MARDVLDTAPREAESAREASGLEPFALRWRPGLVMFGERAAFWGFGVSSVLCVLCGSASSVSNILCSLIYRSSVSGLVSMRM